jgi:HEAT repeat protein
MSQWCLDLAAHSLQKRASDEKTMNEKQHADLVAEIKLYVPGTLAGGAVGAGAALTLRYLGAGIDFYGPVWEVLGAWGAVCGLGITAAFGRLSGESLTIAMLAGAGLSFLKLYVDLADIWILAVTLCAPALIGLIVETGSIKMSWALHRLGYGKGYETPRRAAQTLGKSKDPRVVSALVHRIKKGTATSDAFDALVAIGAPAAESLIDLLTDKDVNIRGNVAEALGRIRDPRAVKPLMALLDNEGWSSTRTPIVRALGKIGDAHCISRLVAELQSPRDECKMEAMEALSETRNSSAVEPLIGVLGDKEWTVRRSTAWALEKMGDVRAIPPLVSSALTDPEIEMRGTAAKALHTLGWQPDSLSMKVDLAFALRDWDELVKLGAAAVNRLVVELQGTEYELRVEAARALGRIGDARAVQPLSAALRDSHSNLANAAATALGQFKDPQAVESLAAALEHNDLGVRYAAAVSLGQIGSLSVEPLLAALKHESANVRRAAAVGLGVTRNCQAAESLAAALRDADAGVRSVAAEGLGHIENERAVEKLVSAWNDPDPGVRSKVAEAISKVKDVTIVLSYLAAALKNENYEVRLLAVNTLGGIKDARAVELIIESLKDPDRIVRMAAARSLGRIGDPQAIQALTVALKDADPAVRSNAARALGGMKDVRTIEPLIASLLDQNADVRSAAVDALSKTKNPRVIKTLVAFLNDRDDPYRSMARKAAKAMGEIGDPSAVEPLLGVLADLARRSSLTFPELELLTATVKTLGQIGDPRAIKLLTRITNDVHSNVRLDAKKALEQIKGASPLHH